jgi:3-phosphoshikimate 1-carboxyvinyltransferase
MKWVVRPSPILAADAVVPGDKSISHRALMLGSIAAGASRIANLAPGADVRSTLTCLQALGADIRRENGTIIVEGGSLIPSASILDAGNSGTTMRLLSGILAGQRFESTLSGDDSLRRRPMKRVAAPLREMGARVSTDDGHAPIRIEGGQLHGITFQPRVPSAQVKSCVLLAALFAKGDTRVNESVKTRDHTERMFRHAGIPIEVDDGAITVTGESRPSAMRIDVPGDFSSAAFLLAAGAIGGDVTVHDVGVNPTRTAFLRVLERMGCDIDVTGESDRGGEPVADVTVRRGDLRGVEIEEDEAAEMLDEMPLVALLGAVAKGETRVMGASELRVKESDRIAAVAQELLKLGARVRELPDGFVVEGTDAADLHGALCDSHGDHRIAMMLAVAGLIASGQTVIEGVECAQISYPGFAATLRSLGTSIDEV